jgi:small subunit ribosomal protein S5e
MSSNGEVEVLENPASGYAVLPKDVTAEIGSVKLFNRWQYDDVEIRDISLTYETTIHAKETPERG